MYKRFSIKLMALSALSLGLQFSAQATTTVVNDGVQPIEYVGNSVTTQYVSAYEIDSKILGRKVLIEVFKQNVDALQPVTYLLDGNTIGMSSFLNDALREADKGPHGKPRITVAIDYTNEQYKAGLNNNYRMLDLTHVRDESLPQFPDQAGAEAFLRFINEEVKPFINSNFNVDTNNQTLFGHSLGGLFSLYTLFSKPDSFDRYLISSPSIMWADRDILSLEEQYAADHQDMDKHLYISVGSKETFMVDDAENMVQRLSNRGYKNLKLLHDVFADTGHLEAGLTANSKGQRALVNEEYMGLANWVSDEVFTKGQSVRYSGHVYQAKWWTKNQQPDMNDKYGAWEFVR